MAVLALGTVFAMAVAAQALDVSGTVDVVTDLYPTFATDVDFGVTVSGDAWTFTSDTYLDLFPTMAASEEIALIYDFDNLQLAANIFTTLVPLGFGSLDVSAAMDVLDITVGEDDPTITVSSNLTVGATISAAVGPYARLKTRLSFGDHWLSNTTTVDFVPLDVASSLLGYLSFGEVRVADGAVTVTAYGYVSADVVPFGFGYAQINAKVAVETLEILNAVTYYGGTSFLAKSTVTLIVLDEITLKVWGSYSSTATDPFSAGASASLPWGPL